MTSLAVDIGGTKIAVARVSNAGAIEGQVRTFPTPATHGATAVLLAVISELKQLDGDGATAIGVSSAGVIDSSTGTVVGATASIQGWPGTQIAQLIRTSMGAPAFVLGDGHAFALGEAVYGQAQNAESLLVLAVGTGVGGAYIAARKPLMGRHWAAGHFGHVPVPQAEGLECYCGKYGHLEAIGGGAGMVRWYHTQGGDPDVDTARELFARIEDDKIAAQVVELGASAIGTAAGGLANAFDPEVVVITGGLSQSGPRWEQPMRASFAQNLIPALAGMPLIISEAGAWLALRGAAYYAQIRKGQQ